MNPVVDASSSRANNESATEFGLIPRFRRAKSLRLERRFTRGMVEEKKKSGFKFNLDVILSFEHMINTRELRGAFANAFSPRIDREERAREGDGE